MKYPVIICQEDDKHAVGGILPDFPNYFPNHDTLENMLEIIQDGIELCLQDEMHTLPNPTPIDEVLKMKEAQGRPVMLVDIDTSFMDNNPVRISMSLPKNILWQIDRKARELGLSRTALMTRAAMNYKPS